MQNFKQGWVSSSDPAITNYWVTARYAHGHPTAQQYIDAPSLGGFGTCLSFGITAAVWDRPTFRWVHVPFDTEAEARRYVETVSALGA